jgi:hypothetical protein
MIQMVSSHIYTYIFLFFKTCPCATHTHTHIYIYILLSLHQNPLNIIFRAVSEVYGTAEAVFTGHIRLAEHVRLGAYTCPGLRFLAYIRGVIT